MAQVTESIDVNVPVRTAYDQWTQFESFPEFMEGVEQVTQMSDTRLHWKAEINGRIKEWDAEVTEQTPDQRVAWTSTTGARNAGVVTFQSLGGDRSRVQLQMDVEPEGAVESAGTALGFFQRQVKGDLERFREFIERTGHETGAWRGRVEGGETTSTGSSSSGVVGIGSRGSDYGARETTGDFGGPATGPGSAGYASDTGRESRG